MQHHFHSHSGTQNRSINNVDAQRFRRQQRSHDSPPISRKLSALEIKRARRHLKRALVAKRDGLPAEQQRIAAILTRAAIDIEAG